MSWEVFQTDVLDVLRQYEGFFDFFERVGSLNDSRPDAFARITREDKKEVWILDAKKKGEVGEEDQKRMEKYIEQVKSSPVDIGLELSELSEHDVRGVFITRKEADSRYEVVEFPRLHQFLQRELIYTDTDRIVRDVAKMVERRELSQSQARLLNRSLKPFRERLDAVMDKLEGMEEDFVGLELHRPPFKTLEFTPPSDAVLTHQERNKVFLIDVPYSAREAERSEEKAREVEKFIDGEGYYVSLHSFEVESEFKCSPEKFREQIRSTLGVVSPEKLAEIYTPKFRTEKVYGDGYIELRSDELGFKLRVSSENDIRHVIEASVNSRAASQIRERQMNSRKQFGKVEGSKWRQELDVSENLELDYGNTETLESYRHSVNNIFHSAVNPVYSKKIARKVE